jgi:hypothetical protein
MNEEKALGEKCEQKDNSNHWRLFYFVNDFSNHFCNN